MSRNPTAVIAILFLTTLVAAAQTPAPARQTPAAEPGATTQRTPATPAALAKPSTPPKTPWGDPDLQGTWTSDDFIGTPLQRPVAAGERLIATEEEIAQRKANIDRANQNVNTETVAPGARVGTGPPGHWGEFARNPSTQTSLIVEPPDGRIPALTPEGQKRQAAAQAQRPQSQSGNATYENFSFYIRCITRGPAGSILPVIYGNGQQIVQAPGYVAILSEMVHEARIIPLDGRPHVGSDIKTYMGDSRGRWEGSTLVVETTNILPNTTGIGLNGGGTPLSDVARLTERFTRVAPNVISYELLVNDEKTWTSPWKIAISSDAGTRLPEFRVRLP